MRLFQRQQAVSVGERVAGPNLLPNTNWQLNSKLKAPTSETSAMKADGSEYQAQIDIWAYDTLNNQPTFYSRNTRELYSGAIVVFGDGHAGLSGSALRVVGLVPNESFKCQLPLGGLSPGAQPPRQKVPDPLIAFAAAISQPGGSHVGPDGGWSKSPTLVFWIDDFPENRCPGAKRVLGLRKAIEGAERFYWTCPTDRILEFAGRRITFGAFVRQKRSKSPSQTSRLFINDGNTSVSEVAVGQAYSDPAFNNYQLLTVTRDISRSVTSLSLGIELIGPSGDIAYFALPTAKQGERMLAADLGQNLGEYLRADTHWNPDILLGFSKPIPSSALINDLFGWPNLDMEALSFCQCHSSVSRVNCKIELQREKAGITFFVAALDVGHKDGPQLVFGPQQTPQANGMMIVGGPCMLPLRSGDSWAGSPPGCFAMFSASRNPNEKPPVSPGDKIIVTFDFDDVVC